MQEAIAEEVFDFTTDDLDAFISYHHETIKVIAKSKGHSLRYATPDDVEQEIMEHLVKNWHLYAGKKASTVKTYFEKAANQFLNRERIDYMYFSAAYIYTPAEIRRHLRDSAWTDADQCPDVDARVDLHTAFKTLTKGRRIAVYKQYGLGIPSGELSEAEGRAARRGVDDITAYLNKKEGVRTYSLDALRDKLFAQL